MRTDLLDLIKRMEAITGKMADIEFREPRAGDVPHSQADNTALRALFPDVKPIELNDGLRLTAEWFKNMDLVTND